MNKDTKDELRRIVREELDTMNNFDQVIQDITFKYRKKIGCVNLEMDKVAHLVGELAFEIMQREINSNEEDNGSVSDMLNGRR